MSERKFSVPFIANVVVFGFNVLLLIFLTSRGLSLIEPDPLSRFTEEEQENIKLAAKSLDMKPYYAKDHFAIFLNQDDPNKDNFSIMHRDPSQYTIATLDTSEENSPVRTFDLTVGNNLSTLEDGFAFSCTYSFPEGTSKPVEVDHVSFTNKNTTFIDKNADGFADLRICMTEIDGKSKTSAAIWYQDKWQGANEVITPGNGDGRRLDDSGEAMSFDKKSGCWISTPEPSNVKQESKTK